MFALPKVRNNISKSTQKVSWKNKTIASLFWSENLVTSIVTVLAVQTVMAIETVMAIMTVVTFVAIVTIVTIKTIMAIETDMVFSRSFWTRPGIERKELVPG